MSSLTSWLPPSLRRRRVLAGAAAGLVLIGAVAIGQQKRGNTTRQLESYTVVAAAGSLPGVVNATGELEAEKRVNVSPKRQGVIDALYVEEGDFVVKGQPLALMDSGDLQDRLRELNANLQSSQAQLSRSRSERIMSPAVMRSASSMPSSPRRMTVCTTIIMATRTAGRRSMEMAPAQLGMKSEA